MKQVVQSVRTGVTSIRDLPDPIAGPGQVVAAASASLISAGTEKYVVDLAKKSLLGKARQRPDHVRRVLQKIKQEGLIATATQVMAKLDEPMPLGYSSAGVVLECGRGIQELRPGDRIAMAAPHAAVVSIGKNLCAKIPDNVTFEQAAYAGVAAIGLQGVRLARVSLGERVLVIGLGLIGQMVVAMLKAQGCRVFATDLDPHKLDLARTFGADEVALGAPAERVLEFTNGAGVDAAIITAATSSNQPIEFAAEVCRVRGRVVLVGVVGLDIPRDPFFRKELEFTVSSSLGPGRGDPSYEEKGIDYPIGYVRWTAQRNMEAALNLMAAGAMPVERLTTHHFHIDDAAGAYQLITSNDQPFLGVVIDYPQNETRPAFQRRRDLRQIQAVPREALGVSVIGVGNFARLVMLPALKRESGIDWRGIVSARGLNADQAGRNLGFAFAATDAAEIWNDPDTHAVFIATRHDLHAEMVIAALRAGKHVFVEKPLCTRADELEAIRKCVEELGERCPVLTVGFNRRFAPATAMIREFLEGVSPLTLSFRFAVPSVPAGVWVQDEEIGGGRIVGEASHAIDTLVAIAGSEPVEVFAQSVGTTEERAIIDDRVFITMRHANGSVSSVAYLAGGDRAAPSERIEVNGGGRTAHVDGWDEVQLWSKGSRVRKSGGKDRGHRAEFRAFLDACRAGGKWPIAWEELYGVTWASFAAMSSLRTGLPVRLDDGEA